MTNPSRPLPADPLDAIDASFVASAPSLEGLPAPALTEIAFAGRSNVGKSSLMNMLLQRRGLVRTSSTPGCTRAVNLFHAKLRNGLELQLADLPGYGFAKRSKTERRDWGPMLEGYLLGRATLRGMVVLIDVRRGLLNDDEDLLEFAASPRQSHVRLVTALVVTKMDLLPKSQRKPALALLKERLVEFQAERLPASGKELARGISIFGASADEGDGRLPIMKWLDGVTRGTIGPYRDKPAKTPEILEGSAE